RLRDLRRARRRKRLFACSALANAFQRVYTISSLSPSSPRESPVMNRRDMLRGAAGALTASAFPLGWAVRADDKKNHKLLVYTRSQTFEHPVVRPARGKTTSLVEEVCT